ncbi:DNA-deoxyinosine glycosylase [Actimicrobium sp. CCI2.3]|uniref:DNA-deoxyinosine glycosylase n=1 Tax=Actimicrobium sp. CCI2.3 TaxID=3048616 RepID=UPI002AB5A5C2|nr:DNA-deoxyinosine glycosylase [Actimicrobium sp. CCI2.3]MDY7575725.1 DNA-deoxyinosine glycosylase [Actimicrobium sp. CCI2.3]MEB0023764.1 DNA-deoxyinosine glycosylase [Actimicrobium sp. CCI2.3]
MKNLPDKDTRSGLLGGLSPVLDSTTRILILGSFPGVASLAAGQYYAHPRNQFWPLLADVLQQPLAAMPYPERLQYLLSQGIGLWDVIDSCQRRGSLDSAIRDARANDLVRLQSDCPQLRRVCFNGKTSAKFATEFMACGIDTLVLPSSSPANAMSSFAQKLAHWRGIIA